MRHIHAPSGHQLRSEHRDLFRAISDEACGDLYLTVGDCNEYAPACSPAVPVFPAGLTFRMDSSSHSWNSCIDGALVSPMLASCTSVMGLEAVPGFQHLPVAVHIDMDPAGHRSWKWFHKAPVAEKLWSADALARFRHLISTNIDLAWEFWHFQVGGLPDHSMCQPSSPHGAWSTGSEADAIFKLFKKQRRLHARGTAAGDRQADAVSMQISQALERLSQERLRVWRENTQSRSKASRWIKWRLAEDSPAALPGADWQSSPFV